MKSLPCLSIALCTYNGSRFIRDQLISISNQLMDDIYVLVSDDGSSDNTLGVIEGWHQENPDFNLDIIEGPKQGLEKNFFTSMIRLPTDSMYFAFSDQDDIWPSDKVLSALYYIKKYKPGIPVLYCARTELVDEFLNHIGFSPIYRKAPHFKNALVESLAPGNTMVWNRAAHALLQEAGADVPAVAHDWWAYQLITGAGGVVIYDPTPILKYRQHDKNVTGTRRGIAGYYRTFKRLISSEFKKRNGLNIEALQKCRGLLTPENRYILEEFAELRQENIIYRVADLFRLGVYRQRSMDNIALYLGALFNKV